MLAKIAKYKAVCIEHGIANDELDGYLQAHYRARMTRPNSPTSS